MIVLVWCKYKSVEMGKIPVLALASTWKLRDLWSFYKSTPDVIDDEKVKNIIEVS